MTRNYTLFAGMLLIVSSMSAMNNPYTVIGLKNLGASCYINAALQVAYAMTNVTQNIDLIDEKDQDGLVAEYADLTTQIKKNGVKCIEPSSFVGVMEHELKDRPGRQGDANEALRKLLESAADIKDVGNLYTTSLISRVYDDKSMDYMSEPRKEEHVALNLKVDPNSPTLEQCLENYFFKPSTERARVDEILVECDRRKRLEESQNYLVLSLDREEHSNDTTKTKYDRIDNPISFPLKDLSLKKYMVSQNNDKGTYELIGVIMHGGNGTGGHYTSFVKSGNQWIFCNDSVVTPVSQEDVEAIANRGYAKNKNMVATTFVYELSLARADYPAARELAPNSMFSTRPVKQVSTTPIKSSSTNTFVRTNRYQPQPRPKKKIVYTSRNRYIKRK